MVVEKIGSGAVGILEREFGVISSRFRVLVLIVEAIRAQTRGAKSSQYAPVAPDGP